MYFVLFDESNKNYLGTKAMKLYQSTKFIKNSYKYETIDEALGDKEKCDDVEENIVYSIYTFETVNGKVKRDMKVHVDESGEHYYLEYITWETRFRTIDGCEGTPFIEITSVHSDDGFSDYIELEKEIKNLKELEKIADEWMETADDLPIITDGDIARMESLIKNKDIEKNDFFINTLFQDIEFLSKRDLQEYQREDLEKLKVKAEELFL